MTAFEVITTIFHELTRSDAIGGDPARWHYYIADQMAHVLIGATLALYRAPVWLLGAVICGWLAKELLGDIPNAGGSWLVMADSLADKVEHLRGFFIRRRLMKFLNICKGFTGLLPNILFDFQQVG